LSQEKMLARLNKPSAPRAIVEKAFRNHLGRVRAWLAGQPNIAVLFVSYNDLVERPAGEAERVSAFLGGEADAASMSKTVDPSLYRNRKTSIEPCSEPITGGTA
jgi:hypothetical protein